MYVTRTKDKMLVTFLQDREHQINVSHAVNKTGHYNAPISIEEQVSYLF